MVSEGERPKSSWQSWVRSAERRRSGDPAVPADEASLADLAPPTDPPSIAVTDRADASALDAAGPFEEAPVVAPTGDADLDVSLDWGAEADQPDDFARVVDAAFDGDDLDDDYGELVPIAPLLPTIAGRVEALSGILRTISHNVDGLAAGTDVYRSTVVDRIDQFTDTVLEQARRSDQALDEYRRTTERTITELRRRLTEQTELATTLLGRVEEIATDVGTLVGGAGADAEATPAKAVGGAPAPSAPPEVDLRPITDTLGVLVEQQSVIERLLGQIEVAESAPAPADASAGVGAGTVTAEVDLAPLLSRLGDIHSLLEVVIDSLPSSMEGSGTDVAVALAEIRAALDPPGRRGRTAPAAAEPSAPAIDDAAVASIAKAVVTGIDLDALAAKVAHHLSATFEVVPEEPVEPAANRRARKK